MFRNQAPTSATGSCMRRRSSASIACSLATMRFFAVFRLTMNAPLLRRFPQWCVKPRNVKVSGFPSPRFSRSEAANRPNSISRVFSGCNSSPNLAVAPETLPGIARLPSGFRNHHQIISISDDDHVSRGHFLAVLRENSIQPFSTRCNICLHLIVWLARPHFHLLECR
jgi:hypothetical protein